MKKFINDHPFVTFFIASKLISLAVTTVGKITNAVNYRSYATGCGMSGVEPLQEGYSRTWSEDGVNWRIGPPAKNPDASIADQIAEKVADDLKERLVKKDDGNGQAVDHDTDAAGTAESCEEGTGGDGDDLLTV